MGMLGKVFGVLVLLLSLAVAGLSWKLAEQRTLFRGHSEALAQGLLQVSKEVGKMDGVDVSAELSKVSYTKAPEGGKESGSLGFEDYRKNQQSVSTGVKALIAAMQTRQTQFEAMAKAVADLGATVGVAKEASINQKGLLTDAEYTKKLDVVRNRAKLVAARDEALRRELAATADKFGVSSGEFSAERFASCAQEGGRFAVVSVFSEFDNVLGLLADQQRGYVATLNDFKNAVDEFSDWNFEASSVSRASAGFVTTSKTSDSDGESARKQYLADLKNKLNVFTADANALNKYLRSLREDKKRLAEQTEELKATAERVQEQKDEMNRKLIEVQASNKKLESENAWARKNLDELKLAKTLNAQKPDPLAGKVVESLKDVNPALACEVTRMELEHNFVIVNANNRQVCPGTRLIVVKGDKKSAGEIVKLEIKECSDYMSTAYVIAGDIKQVKVGDRVELSVEHQVMVKAEADAKAAAEEAKLRAARAAEERRAREAIERRREAERQAGGEVEFGL